MKNRIKSRYKKKGLDRKKTANQIKKCVYFKLNKMQVFDKNKYVYNGKRAFKF